MNAQWSHLPPHQEQRWPEADGRSQCRAEFRAWVRAHHPDVGGDPEAFTAGLTRWRGRLVSACSGRAEQISVFRSRGGWWLITRWWHRRRRLPRVL